MDHPAAGPVAEGDVLYEPTPERLRRARLTAYLAWLAENGRGAFRTYEELWTWSVTDLDGFWSSIWDFAEIRGTRPVAAVSGRGRGVEGARFFEGAELNYLEQVLAHPAADLAVITADESGHRIEVTYGELLALVGAAANGLRAIGVRRGDRVAAVLPNGLEAVVGFLATAALGAVWSSCAPEFGAPSMVDRFSQITPKVLLISDGYRYGGRTFDLGGKARALRAALGDDLVTVVVQALGEAVPTGAGSSTMSWTDLCSDPAAPEPLAVPSDHPLWVLYSSGTTGLPKPIVHSHAGIVLEHVKVLSLHQDLGPADRFCWFTTTGWMMWNYLLGGLLVGATIVCYDGNPMYPDPLALWRVAADTKVSCFGVSAPYLEMCRKQALAPGAALDLAAVRTIGSTGAPLSPEGFGWASRAVGEDVLVGSISGGTDVCTAFLTSCPLLPVRAGELQCRALGAAVEAFDAAGSPVIDEVGELVVTEPMPSMPVELWGDTDGSRLHESYFAVYPGVWRHGDWVKITAEGGAVVYGRSDATVNRGGIRMGTAELYRVVEAVDGVVDSLAVDTSELGRDGELILLVVVDKAADADAARQAAGEPAVCNRIREAIRREVSPRHVPDHVLVVDALPHTLNGKKIEVPIRRILLGAPPSEAVSRDALSDPDALDTVLAALGYAGLR